MSLVDDFYEKFLTFTIEIAAVNVKIRMNQELSPKELRRYNTMKTLIPIYNRLMDNEQITIDDAIVGTNTPVQFSDNPPDYNTVQQKSTYSTTYPSYHNYSRYSPTTVDSDSSTETDDEGDDMVKIAATYALNLLDNLKNEKWIPIDSESDSDSEDIDESESDDETPDNVDDTDLVNLTIDLDVEDLTQQIESTETTETTETTDVSTVVVNNNIILPKLEVPVF